MSLKFLVGIFLAAILTENYILNKFLGICPFLGVSKKLNTAFGMSCAVTVVMVIATAVTWPVYTYVLCPLNLHCLQTVVFILIIAALVQLLETVMPSICRRCITRSAFICRSSRRTAPCWA